MTGITHAHPILPCLNWKETIAFYDKLGFAAGDLFPDQDLIMQRDDIQLHFWKSNDGKLAESSGCTFAAWTPTRSMLNLPHEALNARRPKIVHGEGGSFR